MIKISLGDDADIVPDFSPKKEPPKTDSSMKTILF